jgi:hypothetical protein
MTNAQRQTALVGLISAGCVTGATAQTVFRCESDITLKYTQRDTIASVEGTLTNAICAASSGAFVLVISVRDANGELRTIEFDRTWQREDDQPVVFAAEYPIEDNVDLIRIVPRRMRCSCADAVDAE